MNVLARTKRVVEWIVNFAIIAMCGLLFWSYYTHKFMPVAMSLSQNQETSLRGLTLLAPTGYSWQGRSATLVLVIRAGCHFCEASLPFYKRLSTLEASNSLRANLLAIMPDDEQTGMALLRSGGIAVKAAFKQPLSSLHVTGTPTLLLIDPGGRVLRAWVGQLPPKRQEEVIESLRSK